MAVGDSITPGYNPATFTLGCGFTKTDDSVSTTPDQTCTAGTLTIDGKYNIYFRRRLRETKQYEDVGGNAGVGGYRLYTAANKAAYLTGAGASTANIDMIEFVMCTNTAAAVAESTLTGVIDKESVPIVADGANGTQGPEGPGGRDTGENLIDHSLAPFVVTANGSASQDVASDKTYEFSNLPYSGTTVATQAVITLSGCALNNDAHILVYGRWGSWQELIRFYPDTSNPNQTYKIKDKVINLSYPGDSKGDGKLWVRLANFQAQGTVTFERVKMEVGDKSTAWCLSENDKKGKSGDDGTGFKKVNTYVRHYPIATWESYIRDNETWSLKETQDGSTYCDNSHINIGDTCYIVGKISDVSDSMGNEVDIAVYGVCTGFQTSGTTRTNIIMDMTHYIRGGQDGQNSVRLALDNEHEDFLYDGDTLIAPSSGATSPIRLYDGREEITSFTPEIHSFSGTTQSNTGAYINNRVLYVKSLTAAAAEVVVKTTYNGSTFYAKFTGNKTNQDKYDLVVSPSSIPYNPANYPSGGMYITCSATGIGIGGTSLPASQCVISTAANSGHLRLFWQYVKTDGTKESGGRKVGDTFVMLPYECATYAGLYIELRYFANSSDNDSSSNYRICDYETVEIAKSLNGINGQSSYKSTMFVRMDTTPISPTDEGDYDNPSPDNVYAGDDSAGYPVYWSDGIPSGSGTIWATTRIFTSDGESPQEPSWSTATIMSDSESFDVEFSPVENNPGNPTDNDSNWFDPTLDPQADWANMIWMAERTKSNGAWGSWKITKIKGENGDDAVVYTIECTDTVKPGDDYHDVMICRAEGSNIQRKTLYDAKDDWGVYLTASPNGVTVDDTDPDSQFGVERITITSDTVITLSLHQGGYNGTVIATKEIRGVVDGNNGVDGAPGHIGRWYEFYGDVTDVYPVTLYNTEDHGWFVKKGDYFHMLIADSGSTGDSILTTQNSNSTWEYMGGDRKYYIAEAMFADQAYLGSFVINHDWMISKQGGPSGKTYSDFNPQGFTSYAIGNNPNYNGFIPHFAVDGLTGKVYMNDAYVSGTINASTIKGTIVVGDNTNAKAYMEIVPTTEVTEGSDQVYRADILGKSAGIAGDALDIGVYRLKNSTVMGSHITLREVTTGNTVNGIAHVSPNEIVVADGIGNNAHETSIRPLGINTEDIVADTVYSETEVTTKKVKGVDSEPVAFPSNIITSDRVELDNNLPAGAVVFAPNCEYVKSSKDNVYASRNDDGILNNLTTNNGHKFGNKASRIFVKYSTEYWKEFDCQGP